MNRFALVACTGPALLLLGTWSALGAQPNIFLIVSEDHGPELGCYGDPYARTPHLDRLARDGVLFYQAYVTQAGCSQSRASILTGLYPHQNGQIGLATWGFRLHREDMPNVPHCLKAAGYRTGIIGKLHVNPDSAFPCDMHEIPGGNFARNNLADYARHAEAFFQADDQPFFLHVNYSEAHDPFLTQVDGLPAELLTAADVKSLPHFGIDLLRGKRTCYEGGTRVPLIVRWPGKATPQIRTELVSTIDLPGESHPDTDKVYSELPLVEAVIAAAPPLIRTAYQRQQRPPRYELYDRQTDPYEFQDLTDSAEHAEIFADLKQRLAEWREQSPDPLLDTAILQRLKEEVYSVRRRTDGERASLGLSGLLFRSGAGGAKRRRLRERLVSEVVSTNAP